MNCVISSETSPGILLTTVINLSLDKLFPFFPKLFPLTILSQTRITFSFNVVDLVFSFPFTGGTSMAVFSLPIGMGTLVWY